MLVLHNHDCPGNDIVETWTSTADVCLEQCQQRPGCVAAVFNANSDSRGQYTSSSNNNCFLKQACRPGAAARGMLVMLPQGSPGATKRPRTATFGASPGRCTALHACTCVSMCICVYVCCVCMCICACSCASMWECGSVGVCVRLCVREPCSLQVV